MSKCNIDGESVYPECDVRPFKDMFGTLLWNWKFGNTYF